MKITKIGHSCLLVEEGSAKILIDPGTYNDTPTATGIDAVLITHEHADHIDIASLVSVLKQNPKAQVITHHSVGAMLDKEKIAWQEVVAGGEVMVKGISVKSYGTEHACIHPDIPLVKNTGFLIGERLFHPGDNLYDPGVQVEILALPVAAPWLKIQEVVEYAKKVHPKIVFPIHDGILRQDRLTFTRRTPTMLLEPLDISFVDMTEGSVQEF